MDKIGKEYTFLEKTLRFFERLIPKKIYRAGQPIYHYLLAIAGAVRYRFPSKKVRVVGVTGTKGKSTVVELINTILEEAGYKTALSNTIRFKIAEVEERNMYKMSVRGRFFVQRFLRLAADAGCDWVILEMTSEGTKQFRHKFIDLNALVFTNLSPEHIESHGSLEAYRDAKRKIGQALENSSKKPRAIVANADDEEGQYYLGLRVEKSVPYSVSQIEHKISESGTQFVFGGSLVDLQLKGAFNLENALAAAGFAISQGVDTETIKLALEKVKSIRGRVENVAVGQPFSVVVDYAHTPDSLKKFYKIFGNGHNICVLGNTGGGRDKWKRPEMAHIAEKHCQEIILTNEDPYDEEPINILADMEDGIQNKDKVDQIIDRREAIKEALGRANKTGEKANVLITGKGTDPYIMGPNNTKEPWDDVTVVREELLNMGYNKTTT